VWLFVFWLHPCPVPDKDEAKTQISFSREKLEPPENTGYNFKTMFFFLLYCDVALGGVIYTMI
jgi:hypothetical protein